MKKFLVDILVGIINANASGFGLVPTDVTLLVKERWLKNVREFFPKESVHVVI